MGDAISPVLRLTCVSKAFGPVRALVEVSLEIHAGEVVALVGENGSGKSTLAKILAGALTPDAGTIELGGEMRTWAGPHDALAAGVALVAQEPQVCPDLTVAENVLLHTFQRPVTAVRRRRLEAEAARHLATVGLDVDPAQPFNTLRHGQRELAEMAKALSVEPTVLILDEATTRIPDPEHLFGLVERLCAERQMAAIIITHRLREIRRLSHRAVVLRDGVRVGELGRGELTDERLSAMMVGRELTDFFAKTDVKPGPSVLEVDGVVTDRAPHPISFAVRRGEIVGLAGLVGSGRSELLETIAGIRRGHAGAVTVDGQRLVGHSPSHAMGAGLGFVPEDRWAQGLVRFASICSNIALSRYRRAFRRTDRRGERRQARHAVRRFTIRCTGIDAPVESLSGGNAQKLVLARCIDQRPAVLLLDEPTRGVDIGAKAEIYEIVSEMVAADVGVLIASSDLLELIGLCDRILVLHDGELAGELARAEATEERIALLSAGGSGS